MVNKIRELCEEQGFTVAELERRADLSPRTVGRWDENVPSIDKVARVAKVLGVTIEELLPDPEKPKEDEAC